MQLFNLLNNSIIHVIIPNVFHNKCKENTNLNLYLKEEWNMSGLSKWIVMK